MSSASSTRVFFGVAALTGLTVLGAFWAVAVWLPAGFLPAEYAMWHVRREMIDRCDLGPTVILGDSRAAAGFLPARIEGATNLAMGGSTPVELSFLTDKILRCKTMPRRVVLSVSPELFIRPSWFWDRGALYGVFNFSQLEEIRRRSRAFHDTAFYDAPKLGDWDAILDNGLHSIRFPSYYTSYIVSHHATGRRKANETVALETLAGRGQHGYGEANGSSDIATDAALVSFRPSPLLNDYFERMLEKYAAHGIEVVYLAVPMNRSTFARMNPSVVRDFEAYLKGLEARHGNFRVVGSGITPLDDEYFGDAAHLNLRGAELFSDGVDRMLKQADETRARAAIAER